MVIVGRAMLTAALAQSFGSPQGASIRRSTPADSAHIVRAARSAQLSFEAYRRSHLPRGDGFSGPCDVRIGRYCYWRDDDGPDEQAPPEAPGVRERRAELIAQLDSASDALPGDEWLAGQRVRYLVEAKRTDDALHFATSDCRASVSWCEALAGYAAHVAGRFATADSAYRVALAAMDEAERCRWLDVSDELEGELEKRFEAVACASGDRESFVRRLFWLGSPLFSIASTDLLTEHFARLTRTRIAEHAETTDGIAWGDDDRRLVLRYGWPEWYTRTDPQMGSMLPASFTGHDAGRPYNFLPAASAVDHLATLSANDWRLDDRFAATGYAPAYARSVNPLVCQIAAFRRGDSTLVVAAWDARRDTTLLGRPLEAALALSESPDASTILRRDSSGVVGRIAVEGKVDSAVASLELLAGSARRAARSRIGIAARGPSRIALSDLLMYASASPAFSLNEVRDSALATNVIASTQSFGVYWESYGLRAQGEPVQFTLSVDPVNVGWLRRTASHFHLADPTSGLRIQWDEVPRVVDGVAGRGVRLDLSRLHPGTYRMLLTLTPRGDPPVSAQREITVDR